MSDQTIINSTEIKEWCERLVENGKLVPGPKHFSILIQGDGPLPEALREAVTQL